MKRRSPASVFARLWQSVTVALVFVAVAARAQSPSPPAIGAAPAPESSPPGRREAVDRLQFHFSLQPPPSPEASGSSANSRVSSPVTDTPAPADVVRLPKFEVRDRRIDLTEREVLNERGLIDAAKQRYLTPAYQKTFGQLSELALLYFNPLALLGGWHPNDAEAMTLYEQDERLRRMRRSDELLDLYHLDDTKDAIKLKELLYDTYRHEQAPPTHGHHDQ
jgi:hypothetical protein